MTRKWPCRWWRGYSLSGEKQYIDNGAGELYNIWESLMVRCFVTLYFFVYRMHAHEKCVLFIIYEDLQVNMSNTTRFSKIRSFFGFKFTRQEMEAIQTRISEANHRGLLIAVRISTLYFVILFVLSLFVHAIFPFRKLYAVTGILDLVLYFLVRRTRREDGRRNLFLVYICLLHNKSTESCKTKM